MNIVVDIGNTNIKFGFYKENQLSTVLTIRTVNLTEDEYYAKLKPLFLGSNIKLDSIKSCFISSVVPEVNTAVSIAIEKLVSIAPKFLEVGVKTGVSVKLKSPHEVGADLIGAAAGAISKSISPVIIVGLGTATTFTILNAKKELIGVSIASGLEISRLTLSSNTSLLKQVDLKVPNTLLGGNTTESMQSGIIFGQASMIDGMIKRIQNELKTKTKVIAFGGFANLIAPLCETDINIYPNLLLDGLNYIGGLNNEK